MRVDNSITALAGDVVYGRLKVTEICVVEWTTQASGEGTHTLHGERNTEGVEAMIEKKIKRGGCGLLLKSQCQLCNNWYF